MKQRFEHNAIFSLKIAHH